RRARSTGGGAAAELLIEEATMRAIAMALVCACALGARGDEKPRHAVPNAKRGGTVVGLCDGETTTEVQVAPGTPLGRADAQRVSDELMAEWRRKHPEANWDDALAQQQQQAQPQPGAPARAPEAAPKPTTATKAPPAAQPHDQTGVYS